MGALTLDVELGPHVDAKNVCPQIGARRDKVERVDVVLVEAQNGCRSVCLCRGLELLQAVAQPAQAVQEDGKVLGHCPDDLVVLRHLVAYPERLRGELVVVEGLRRLARLPHALCTAQPLNVLLEDLVEDEARKLLRAHGLANALERLGLAPQVGNLLGVVFGVVAVVHVGHVVLAQAKHLCK
jgi:hypothetical protein